MPASLIRFLRLQELWFSAVLVSTLAIQIADSALLQLKFAYFNFGSEAFRSMPAVYSWISYLALSTASDIFFTSALVSTVFFALRPLMNPSSVAFLALIIPISIGWVFAAIQYKIFSYFRDSFDFYLLRSLGGGRLGDSLKYLSPEIVTFGAPLLLISALLLLIFRILRRYPNWAFPSPEIGRRRFLIITFSCFALSVTGALASKNLPEIQFGLSKKLSFIVFGGIIDKITDFDSDGYGIMSAPPDPDLLNPQIHPFALDTPSNGVDENGVAGDLPMRFVDELKKSVAPSPAEIYKKRTVVLIVLETFRWDVLGSKLGGIEITPNLNRLAKEGLSIPLAYSQSPVTENTLRNIYLGTPCAGLTETSIFDDFARLGYETAIFSGSDESYGGVDRSVGLERADKFYDARLEPEHRMYPGNLPMSRMIGAKHLNKRIFEFLGERDRSRPLFLYVNFQDAHFPYSYPGLDNILNISPVARRKMSKDNAPRVRETYLNAITFTDRELGNFIERLKGMGNYEDTVILITGDHGEDLFEEGYLGHGTWLSDIQTHVPFILINGGIDVRYPVGHQEIRWILHRALENPDGGYRGQAIADENKRVFQYLGFMRRPNQIALASSKGRILYDFRRNRILTSDDKWSAFDAESLDAETYREAAELIHTWEACQIYSSPKSAPAGSDANADLAVN
ncbi:MAG: sulfatase-like hydrolase/transferase [Deltaproteobacteria bacterium]